MLDIVDGREGVADSRSGGGIIIDYSRSLTHSARRCSHDESSPPGNLRSPCWAEALVLAYVGVAPSDQPMCGAPPY